MHGGAAGEVEAAEEEGPAVGVPGPAGDGVVDDGGPDEDEDEDGAEAGAFGEGADGEHGGDGGEHELVDAEEDGGDAGGADGGLFEDAFEAEVFCAGVRGATRYALWCNSLRSPMYALPVSLNAREKLGWSQYDVQW